MENVKIKAKEYLQKANENWKEIVRLNYLCYENDLELASEIVYKLFEKTFLMIQQLIIEKQTKMEMVIHLKYYVNQKKNIFSI